MGDQPSKVTGGLKFGFMFAIGSVLATIFLFVILAVMGALAAG